MLRNKNTFDISVFSGDLFQDSIDINSLFMSESNHFPMEVIHKFFQKSFKLRNVSKQGYWERKRTRSSSYLIKVSDLMPIITFSHRLILSIKDYIDNESSMLVGKLDLDKRSDCYSSIIDSKCEKNVMINPRLIVNKEEKKNKLLSMIETAYNELNNNKTIKDNDNYNGNAFIHSRCFHLFNRKEDFQLKNNYSILYKVYSIVPNVHFELNQIKNVSFSNTQLNKFLVLKSYENESFDPKKQFKSGFLTMSQEHRLICLRDDTNDKGIKSSQSLRKIILGIWLNMKDESPSYKKIDLDNLLTKHKMYIYQKCFEYIQLTSSIDSVYSPSPDQSIFLLVIFYRNMQCHYEVTLIPNEEDSLLMSQIQDEKKLFAQRFSSQWLIVKNKYVVNQSQSMTIDLRKEVFDGRVMTMNDYIYKKTGIKSKSFLTKSTGTRITTPSPLSCGNYYKDTLNEIFDNTDLENDNADDDLYNYPLIMPLNFKAKDFDQSSNPNSKQNTNPNQIPTPKKEIEKQHNKTIIMPQKKTDDTEYKNNKESFKKSISNYNLKEKTMTTSIKSIEEVSHASTNVHSTKISIGSSNKNSFNKPSILNSNYIPGKYFTIINEQKEAIKILKNKISALESNINSVFNELTLPNYITDNKNENNKDNIDETGERLLTECKCPKIEKEKINLMPHYLQTQLNINEKCDESSNVSIKIPCIQYNQSIFSEDEDSNI